MNEIDIDKVKGVVDTLVKGKAVDRILKTMDSGFGEVSFKITIRNGIIKTISVTETSSTLFE